MGGPQAAVRAAQEALGLSRLESFPVQHCAHAYGCVLESAAGWKLALSGDTRPCPAVAEAARDATILIHEVRGIIGSMIRSIRVRAWPSEIEDGVQVPYAVMQVFL